VSAAEELYERLRGINEPKGYYFSNDKPMVMELLAGLLENKERYGYMSCPCRLSSGHREADKDILCPCSYRADDIAKYGSCFCQLYVTKEWNEGAVPHEAVPESRPPEKLLAALSL